VPSSFPTCRVALNPLNERQWSEKPTLPTVTDSTFIDIVRNSTALKSRLDRRTDFQTGGGLIHTPNDLACHNLRIFDFVQARISGSLPPMPEIEPRTVDLDQATMLGIQLFKSMPGIQFHLSIADITLRGALQPCSVLPNVF